MSLRLFLFFCYSILHIATAITAAYNYNGLTSGKCVTQAKRSDSAALSPNQKEEEGLRKSLYSGEVKKKHLYCVKGGKTLG